MPSKRPLNIDVIQRVVLASDDVADQEDVIQAIDNLEEIMTSDSEEENCEIASDIIDDTLVLSHIEEINENDKYVCWQGWHRVEF